MRGRDGRTHRNLWEEAKHVPPRAEEVVPPDYRANRQVIGGKIPRSWRYLVDNERLVTFEETVQLPQRCGTNCRWSAGFALAERNRGRNIQQEWVISAAFRKRLLCRT